jgi:hypothetical protein
MTSLEVAVVADVDMVALAVAASAVEVVPDPVELAALLGRSPDVPQAASRLPSPMVPPRPRARRLLTIALLRRTSLFMYLSKVVGHDYRPDGSRLAATLVSKSGNPL